MTEQRSAQREDTSEAETLRRLGQMPRFNGWIWNLISHWVGNRILEAGCGLGNFTRFLARRGEVVAFDNNEDHLREFREINPDLIGVELKSFDAGNPELVQLGPGSFDTVLCLNVLEHVEDDEQAVRSFRDLLKPGGHLILLAPAYPSLFGTLDLNGPHYRRYRMNELSRMLRNSGYEIVMSRYFNLFGIPGWWWCGKVLKKPILPSGGLGIYEKLVPLFRLIEKVTGPPMGLSILLVARKVENTRKEQGGGG